MTQDTKDKLFEAFGYCITAIIILGIVGGCVFYQYLDIQRDKEREERAELREQQEKVKEDSIEKAKNTESLRTAKYLYVDAKGVLHIDRYCIVLMEGYDKADFSSGVSRLLMSDLTGDMLSNCCSSCINDEEYELLLDTVE